MINDILNLESLNEDEVDEETALDAISKSELAEFLTRELDFPQGVFLMTGTCLVPDDFTLLPGDVVTVQVGETQVENPVTA